MVELTNLEIHELMCPDCRLKYRRAKAAKPPAPAEALPEMPAVEPVPEPKPLTLPEIAEVRTRKTLPTRKSSKKSTKKRKR